jgi:ribose transport system substrate-binding protein
MVGRQFFRGMTMNILWKRTVCALLLGAMPLLVACERHTKSERFYLVANSTKHAYWQSAWAGFSKAADEYGVTVDMRGPDGFDPQAEVTEFRAAVALQPSGILVQVANEALMRPEIDAAVAAGIPVITIDSDAPLSHRLFFIGTNNLQAGRLGGARVATQLKGKGNVVFFTIAGQPNLEERLKGYKDALASYPDIKVVDVFDMKGDSGVAMDQTREYLARTGAAKIDAVVCLESTAGKDVGEAFKREGAKGTILVAMDVDQATLNLVKDGTIDSTISQKPFTMAYLGLKALDDVYHYPVKPLAQDYAPDQYAPFPAFVDTGVALVDKSNVDAILKHESGAGGSQ